MAQVNGDIPTSPSSSSAFVRHLLNYPVVNDGVKSFQQNDLGQRSMRLGDSAYRTFAAPVMAYMSRPYQYVSPYVRKADDLGDKTLCRVDEHFPAITKPTGELYAEAKSVILFPYNKGVESKDHALQTYSAEFKKMGGEGVVTYGKALVSTVFLLSTETLGYIASFLSARKAQTKEMVNEKANN